MIHFSTVAPPALRPPKTGITRSAGRDGACLRLRFFRSLLHPLAQALGPALEERLRSRLPNHLRPYLDRRQLQDCGPMDSIELELAEDLLEVLEQALGDRAGHLLEAAAYDIFSHALAEQHIHADETPIATVARLRPAFERLGFGATPAFDVGRLPSGFIVVLLLPGRPRMAEPLRKLGVGAIRAALHANSARAGRECRAALRSGVDGDRAWIFADQRRHH
jgi:hypothetical protein